MALVVRVDTHFFTVWKDEDLAESLKTWRAAHWEHRRWLSLSRVGEKDAALVPLPVALNKRYDSLPLALPLLCCRCGKAQDVALLIYLNGRSMHVSEDGK